MADLPKPTVTKIVSKPGTKYARINIVIEELSPSSQTSDGVSYRLKRCLFFREKFDVSWKSDGVVFQDDKIAKSGSLPANVLLAGLDNKVSTGVKYRYKVLVSYTKKSANPKVVRMESPYSDEVLA